MIVYYIFAALYLVMAGVFFTLFITRRHIHPIKSRGVFWSLLSAGYGTFYFVEICFRLADPSSFPCGLWLIAGALNLCLWAAPYLFRTFTAYFKFRWNTEKIERKERWYLDHQYLISFKLHCYILIALAILHLLVEIAISVPKGFPTSTSEDPKICDTDTSSFAQNLLAIIYPVLGIILIYKMRRVKDAYHIKSEMAIILGSIVPVFLVYLAFSVLTVDGVETAWFQLIIYTESFVGSIIYPVILSYVGAERLKRTDSFDDMLGEEEDTTDLNEFYLQSVEVDDAGTDSGVESEISVDEDKAAREAAKVDAAAKEVALAAREAATSSTTINVNASSNKIDLVQPLSTPSNSTTPASATSTSTTTTTAPNSDITVVMSAVPRSQKASRNDITNTSTSTLDKMDGKKTGRRRRINNGEDVELIQVIIENPIYLEAFKKFSIQSWCSENIMFYLDVMNFKSMPFSQATLDKIKADYLLPMAPYEINIPQTVMQATLKRIEEGNCDTTVLDKVFQLIFKTLKFDIYPRFRLSNLFKEARKKVNSSTMRA